MNPQHCALPRSHCGEFRLWSVLVCAISVNLKQTKKKCLKDICKKTAQCLPFLVEYSLKDLQGCNAKRNGL